MNEDLVNAVREGDLETVRRLLDAGARLKPGEAMGLVQMAASRGHAAVLQRLLEYADERSVCEHAVDPNRGVDQAPVEHGDEED